MARGRELGPNIGRVLWEDLDGRPGLEAPWWPRLGQFLRWCHAGGPGTPGGSGLICATLAEMMQSSPCEQVFDEQE
jgi:hypothetical protein